MSKTKTQAIFQAYFIFWAAYYSANQFGGTCIKTAAEFAALDAINMGKQGKWTEADYLDDLQYLKAKTA
jgi:hypothetical protein